MSLAGMTSDLKDRLRRWRDRLISDPRFQRWSLGNPLTRAIARRRSRAMLDLCAGFVYSQTLFACVRLKLFDILKDGPLSIEALSQKLELSADATRRLLDASSSISLTERRGAGRYGLGRRSSAMRRRLP